jgi:hypothetical protein
VNPATDQPEPNLVVCRCHYCEGDIEFDASGFNEGDNCTLTCPHCQTETTVTIPPPAPAPPTPPPTLAEIQKLKVAQIKISLRSRLESGKPVFLFDSFFLPVDSEILDKQFASEFDVSILRRLGLMGWEIVQAVPKTKGIGLENVGTQTTIFGSMWAGGVGGNVMGVHVIIKKSLSVSDITDDSADDVSEFIRNHLSDFLTEE